MRPDIAPPFRDAPAASAAGVPAASLAADRPAAVSAVSVGSFSVLAWPAWLRVLAVLPAVALLWLGVLWAQAGAAPW